MNLIFKKSDSLKAPGGDRYEWKEAEAVFAVPKDGLFAIKIEASAKNAKQNGSGDDDDLRVSLDGFDFGKYEQIEGSWKGFNVSASWNGATLKGGTKTVYFFANLNKGSHVLQFFADETPVLKSIEVYEITDHSFGLSSIRPPEKIKSTRNGIPWLSFVFLGAPSKNITLGVGAKSAKTKGGTDGDNLKVVINGRTLPNVQAPTSDKYKNFCFSGDLKEWDVLTLTDEQLAKPLAFENAVELWYDGEPEITEMKIGFFDNKAFINNIKSLTDLRSHILNRVYAIVAYFEIFKKSYSAQFLRHAIEDNPTTLVFDENDPIAKQIKADPVYQKIVQNLKEKIKGGVMEGEIWPEDFKTDPRLNGQINFNSDDLATALHGVKKIEYTAKRMGNGFSVNFTIFDVYDFEKQNIPNFVLSTEYIKKLAKTWAINHLDKGEDLKVIKNFEIQIHLTELLNAD